MKPTEQQVFHWRRDESAFEVHDANFINPEAALHDRYATTL